ncbi:DUF6474 family protein [Sciscionella sediminilitoris]|uniref:DUF6474 family protein n=1 Tax=Sciscionella sediminilitoris TaxID=1445613 RepID=UPI0004DF9952|nr:DUF6474 family protein [Sciscionella sp. SE31]
MARKDKTGEAEQTPRITPGKAKNAVKVVRVLAPSVLPVVAPYAAQAAAYARDGYDRLRARRLGIAVDQLGEYTGRGAAMHARINGLRSAVGELAESAERTEDDLRFATRSASTLDKLATAVRAAERMPTARRRAAHRAVAEELDIVEAGLLARLGVVQ